MPLCPLCNKNEAGVEFEYDVMHDDADENGEIQIPGPCQSCIDERKKQSRIDTIKRKQKSIDEIPHRITKYGVYPLYKNAVMNDINEKLREKISSMPNNIYIQGPAGTGKTHLAVAMLNQDLRERKEVLFITVTNLLIEIKSTFNSQSDKNEQDIVEKYSDVDNLYLDDIGAERITDWSASLIYSIIDRRYGFEKRTIFTSNLTLDELNEKLGGRISSRIAGMCEFIELLGDDRRLKK